MRLYLDTEFIEDGRTIDLVSIALVSENGDEFYRQNCQAPFERANEFVVTHVLPGLRACQSGVEPPRHIYGACNDSTCVWRPRRVIAYEIMRWVRNETPEPEFWGWYADYDWVVLCQLFGRMIDLPHGWPMYCRDLKQYADDFFPGVGLMSVVPQEGEHNALMDARWISSVHRWMISQEEVMETLDAGRQANKESGLREAAPVLRSGAWPGAERRQDADRDIGGGASGQGPEAQEVRQETEVASGG